MALLVKKLKLTEKAVIENVIIRVMSGPARKQVTPVIHEEEVFMEVEQDGQMIKVPAGKKVIDGYKEGWVCEYQLACFDVDNNPLGIQRMNLLDPYDPTKPCEQQIYEFLKTQPEIEGYEDI